MENSYRDRVDLLSIQAGKRNGPLITADKEFVPVREFPDFDQFRPGRYDKVLEKRKKAEAAASKAKAKAVKAKKKQTYGK